MIRVIVKLIDCYDLPQSVQVLKENPVGWTAAIGMEPLRDP